MMKWDLVGKKIKDLSRSTSIMLAFVFTRL